MNTHRKTTAAAAVPTIIPSELADTALIRHIEKLADDASTHVRSAAQSAYDCGLALLVARDRCPHGEWGQWLEDHWNHSPRLAQTYMQLAKAQRSADLDLRTKSIAAAMRSITTESVVEQDVQIHVGTQADARTEKNQPSVQPAPPRSAVPDLPPVFGGAGLNSASAATSAPIQPTPAFSPDAASRLREIDAAAVRTSAEAPPDPAFPDDDTEWEDVEDDEDGETPDAEWVTEPGPPPSSDLSAINQWLEDFDLIHNRLLALTKLVARLPEDVRAQLEAML